MTAKTSDWRPGPSVCRCCFAEGCYKDISTEYFWMGKKEVYSEMLTDTFDVTIAYAQTGGPNSNSRLICEPCISRLRDASDFKRQVQECEKVFLHHLAQPGSSLEYELPESSDKDEVKLERIKEEAKVEDDDDYDDNIGFPDDDDDDDMDDEPLTKLASKVPKEESDDLLRKLLLDETKKPEKRKSSTKVKTSPAKKTKKKDSPKPASKAAPKAVVDKKKKGEIEWGSNHEIRHGKMQNAEIVLQYSTAYPFRLKGVNTILCVYCLDEFQHPDEFRHHVDEEHKDFKVSSAVRHSKSMGYVKADCYNLRCRLCLAPSETLEEIALHLYEIHGLEELDLEQDLGIHPYKLQMDKWQCIVCDKKCASIYSLSRHTTTHFSKHTCDICGKSYLTKMALKYHIRCTHTKNHTCRKCWKEFTSKEEKADHIKNSKRCQPFICITCGERFLSWELKEKHRTKFHGQSKNAYQCPDCEEVFDTRRIFYNHYKLKHTDDCYICSCCGMKFVRKHRLDEHLRGHTGEKMFSCEVCPKQFSLKKNLIQHMWIHSEKKRFLCQICDKQFAQKVSLKTHMKSYHPVVEDQVENTEVTVLKLF